MTGERRRTDYLPLDDVLRAPRNPKGHAAELIAGSMKKFGVVELPALDERTGRLVAGHGRLDEWVAARNEGSPPPNGVDLADDGTWLVPVTRGWASTTDAEAEAYLVVSNASTMFGGWDDPELAVMLSDLRDTDQALLVLTGYDESFIDRHTPQPPDPWGKAEPEGDGGALTEHLVVVVCDTADDQAALYVRLTGEGLVCRQALA